MVLNGVYLVVFNDVLGLMILIEQCASSVAGAVSQEQGENQNDQWCCSALAHDMSNCPRLCPRLFKYSTPLEKSQAVTRPFSLWGGWWESAGHGGVTHSQGVGTVLRGGRVEVALECCNSPHQNQVPKYTASSNQGFIGFAIQYSFTISHLGHICWHGQP